MDLVLGKELPWPRAAEDGMADDTSVEARYTATALRTVFEPNHVRQNPGMYVGNTGSAGIHRLREELLARANIAAAPARVVDILFTEMLVQ